MASNNDKSILEGGREGQVAADLLEVQPAVSWKTISSFVVQVNKSSKITAPVYANGRQQVPVEISIEALDANDVVVKLTQSQLDSIKLIHYETDKAVYGVYAKDERYIYTWNMTGEDGAEVDSGAVFAIGAPELQAQTVMKYVHLEDVETIWVAAEITSPEGVAFRTNTPNPTPGKFDSWVKIQGREPVSVGWEEFGISPAEGVVHADNWDVDLYYVYFKSPNFRIVDAKTYRNQSTLVYFRRSNSTVGNIEHLWFAITDKYEHVDRSCADQNRKVRFNVNSRPEQATVARVIDYLGGGCGNGMNHHGLMGYVDQYGNESKVTLKVMNHASTIALGDPRMADEKPQ